MGVHGGVHDEVKRVFGGVLSGAIRNYVGVHGGVI